MQQEQKSKTSSIRPTKKQKELLEFIESFIAEHGYSPSYREIRDGCSYNSVATVAVHVNNLITRGHLVKRSNSARSLEVVHKNAQSSASQGDTSWFMGQVAAHFENPQSVDDLYVLLGTLKILGLSDEFETYKQKLLERTSHD